MITITHIRTTLQHASKNSNAHSYMQPSFRGTFPSTDNPKESAVLLLIFERNNQPVLVFTKRTENPADKHSGQISFPGGSKEITDIHLQQTAIRETFEEIGIQCNESNIVFELSSLHIPISNFIVHPFVAILPQAPNNYILQESEVGEILEIPISHLLQASTKKTKILTLNNQDITIPYYEYNTHHIWGATGMISAELLDIIVNYNDYYKSGE